ncbi:GGDEF domain-containing phosphodiesterase [Candidatus Oleimmundimicrobium sp.]|uniref:bifunctional diguanylate cyclase/phosphodiesterase n=1 Tax=Candidatus Oleimmundimicrobium sp. TaxID=3060597 RepID=UPI00271BADF0|nr:GGDEF domain-containing phosphodiesterase [Candidatus Oleimmundimicrobium sp.]MDO8886916.1 GGDEF domain-containing phosphodiesterase [Candidatus Oleimmundimicrobium sp.]
MKRTDSATLKSWIELNQLVKEKKNLEILLHDKVTGLPTIPLLFNDIEKILKKHNQIGLLCIDIVKYSKIEEIYGYKAFDEVIKMVAETLKSLLGETLREADIVSQLMISGNTFTVLLSPPRKKTELTKEDLTKIKKRVSLKITETIRNSLDYALFKKFGCYVGCAILNYNKNIRLERQLYTTLEEALKDSATTQQKDIKRRMTKLKKIIENEEIYSLFQPIVKLPEYKIIGYEALSRGPGGEFERPDKLFTIACASELVIELERLCRKKALSAASNINPKHLLFLNVEPDSVNDPELRQIAASHLLMDSSLNSNHIVLEVTERAAIENFSVFKNALEYFRALGFKIAIDDGGAGYATLESMVELKPDFIKIDMSLIRNIDTDSVKQQLVKALINFGKETNIKMIAEGIETKAELKTLLELDIHLGQGYVFAYPSEPFPKIRKQKLTQST